MVPEIFPVSNWPKSCAAINSMNAAVRKHSRKL
jgi:hypothetical protein